jgi:hypothetical protein
MAIAVIGGLVVSTALSLFVVPAFFVAADGAQAKVKAAWAARRKKKTPKEAAAPAEAARH